jgi:hypothetical protein
MPQRLLWAAAIFLVGIVGAASLAAETNNAVQAPIPIISAQGLTAIANLLSAILWPMIALLALLLFKAQLVDLLSRVKSGKLGVIDFELVF